MCSELDLANFNNLVETMVWHRIIATRYCHTFLKLLSRHTYIVKPLYPEIGHHKNECVYTNKSNIIIIFGFMFCYCGRSRRLILLQTIYCQCLFALVANIYWLKTLLKTASSFLIFFVSIVFDVTPQNQPN